MSRTHEELLSETITLYGRATRVLDPMRLQVWEGLGIALPQLRILFRVRATPGIDLRSLAAELNISPSAASQQVDKLVERGLLTRTQVRSDRRRVSLELTELGRDATRALSRAARGYLESVLGNLSDDELRDLHRLLDRVLTAAATLPVPHGFQPEDVEIEEELRRGRASPVEDD